MNIYAFCLALHMAAQSFIPFIIVHITKKKGIPRLDRFTFWLIIVKLNKSIINHIKRPFASLESPEKQRNSATNKENIKVLLQKWFLISLFCCKTKSYEG